MPLSIETQGLEELEKAMKKVPGELFDEARSTYQAAILGLHTAVTNRIRNGVDGSLHSRTGNLRRSFTFETVGDNLDTLNSHLVSTSSYAPIHETGGTIVAQNAYASVPGGPYLNIPSRQNLTQSGVLRMTARQVFSAGGHIRPTPFSPKSRYAVFLNNTPMFWLVKSVEIPARLRLQELADQAVEDLIIALGEAIDRAFEEADLA